MFASGTPSARAASARSLEPWASARSKERPRPKRSIAGGARPEPVGLLDPGGAAVAADRRVRHPVQVEQGLGLGVVARGHLDRVALRPQPLDDRAQHQHVRRRAHVDPDLHSWTLLDARSSREAHSRLRQSVCYRSVMAFCNWNRVGAIVSILSLNTQAATIRAAACDDGRLLSLASPSSLEAAVTPPPQCGVVTTLTPFSSGNCWRISKQASLAFNRPPSVFANSRPQTVPV